MKYKKTCLLLTAVLVLAMVSVCGASSGSAELLTEETSNAASTSSKVEAEDYAASIDNATIDAAIYLDYSAGLEAGVYRWILSDDGSYYVLAAVDEDGEPITMEEAAINVGSGSNNMEAPDMGNGEMPVGDFDTSELSGNEMDASELPDADNEDGKFDIPDSSADGKGFSGAPDSGVSGFSGGSSGTVYQGVYINANITNTEYQTMLIYVPAEYFTLDEDGNVTGIDYEASVGNYTASTAPILYWNECGGWRSSQPGACDATYIEQGMIYVAAGARSRDASDEDGNNSGKSPTQVVDLKSGVIQLRANSDVIPGNTDQIISAGGSGGGQMSSILGASGNMSEYYEYMYEAGVLGVTLNDDGTYSSAYADNVYAAQCFCPIADIENADLAYAWWWFDLTGEGGESYNGSELTEFQIRLQELEAEAFVDYINSLNLTDEDGNALTLTGLRSGTYYEAVLQNISNALNAMVVAGEIDPETEYSDYEDWLTLNDDGTYSVTDMAGFMIGTGLVNNRGKDVPGFDTFGMTAEGNAFGTSEEQAVHFSAAVATILQDNYEELSALDGFEDADVDEYIEQVLNGDESDFIENQVNLMNATEILLGNSDLTAVTPAQYWRVRSGTADQHTSFTIGYNICLAAQSAGLDANYALVWNMGHGNDEGTTTGTLVEWINEICTLE